MSTDTSLSDLNDDVLRLIIEHIKDFNDVCEISRVSRRMFRLARPSLLRFKYSRFPIGINHSRPSLYIVYELLRLIEKPSLTGYVTCISSMERYWDENVGYVSEAERQTCLDYIRLKRTALPTLDPEIKAVLNIIESDWNQLCTYFGWVRLSLIMLQAVLWLCPAIRELEIWGAVVRTMQVIGSRFSSERCLPLTPGTENLTQFDYIAHMLRITRLKLKEFYFCEDPENYVESFDLFLLPTLQSIKIKLLEDRDSYGYHGTFWPSGNAKPCNARSVSFDFYWSLPSPLLLADLLSNCPSLEKFELRGLGVDNGMLWDDEKQAYRYDGYVEKVDLAADKALMRIDRSDVKGLSGYVDLMKIALTDLFAKNPYRLDCFLPCRRYKHRFLRQPKCFCIVISITKS